MYKASSNQTKAAKILYVHRNTLINKIKKYEQNMAYSFREVT